MSHQVISLLHKHGTNIHTPRRHCLLHTQRLYFTCRFYSLLLPVPQGTKHHKSNLSTRDSDAIMNLLSTKGCMREKPYLISLLPKVMVRFKGHKVHNKHYVTYHHYQTHALRKSVECMKWLVPLGWFTLVSPEVHGQRAGKWHWQPQNPWATWMLCSAVILYHHIL